ncbi:hypothetical protein AGABI2DRAFT_190715 [Agaricus bisporus var. bisporus H97]|uniref:hypothetical protein n=1 Tax=Agaricus bisporus var. bisporus (strain H97 / ATCC MYA-4626 / FGSC 10389) TaxID=936046 RepID=UPI00029F67FF|nr:hypothetical protein AGABI2DRAFT_190715 [Agaricus bisporus var. bisporus H97]EKV50392.1 hypothetical protein AGABI2DRAFT_190715 [Agaricus bisporus var. bisporus H97]
MSAPIENPMNAAHNHAANAEEHMNSGRIDLAMEEHFKAATAYMAAIERSHDESAKRTLRMLHGEQIKAGRDLQRKVEKLKEEGKDPSQPQPKSSAPTANAHQVMHTQRALNSSPKIPSRIGSPQPPQRMIDTVDESFMLLGGQRSEPGDPFTQFWNIMQGMLDTLSSPVAFATAPIGNPENADIQNSSPNGSAANLLSRVSSASGSLIKRDSSFGNIDTEADEPIFARLGRTLGKAKESIRQNYAQKSSHLNAAEDDDDEDFDESLFDDSDELSESFLVIPSGSEQAALRKENTSLKLDLVAAQKRLEMVEKRLHLREKQDQQLRDSIYQATREAQRVMGASVHRGVPDLGTLNLNVPSLPIPGVAPPNRENQYLQRIKELENEVRQARIENEKNQAMIRKYRERWEKLKESAKKRKDAKAAAIAAASPVREKIVEEPEVEEELDNTY